MEDEIKPSTVKKLQILSAIMLGLDFGFAFVGFLFISICIFLFIIGELPLLAAVVIFSTFSIPFALGVGMVWVLSRNE